MHKITERKRNFDSSSVKKINLKNMQHNKQKMLKHEHNDPSQAPMMVASSNVHTIRIH